MAKKKIKVYTELDKIKESTEFFAIIKDDVIKYIDLTNNKMIIDMQNDMITRENKDYVFVISLRLNKITVKVKKLMKHFVKEIKVLTIEKKRNSYLIRYLLYDEEIINEYYVNF